jgi:hypothetical protein
VATVLRPRGCGHTASSEIDLPRARHALEVDYGRSASSTGAVGIGLEYPDAAAAARFVTTYRWALSTCTPSGGRTGTLAVTVLGAPAGAALLTRQEDAVEQTTWTEMVAQRGRVVTILGVDTGSGPGLPHWGAVARSLR